MEMSETGGIKNDKQRIIFKSERDAAIRSPAKMNAGIARKVNTLRARNAPMEIATLVPPCAR